MKDSPKGWPRISSSLFYEDAGKAIDWLCRAFGFEVRLKVEGEDGSLEHSELVFGEGLIMVGQQGHGDKPEHQLMVSPRSIGVETPSASPSSSTTSSLTAPAPALQAQRSSASPGPTTMGRSTRWTGLTAPGISRVTCGFSCSGSVRRKHEIRRRRRQR